MLLVGRRWRAIGVGLVVAALLAVLATVVLGPAIWGDYLRFLSRYVSTFDELSVRPSVMWNVRGHADPADRAGPGGRAGGPDQRRWPSSARSWGCWRVAWLWRGSWSPTTPDFDLRFALTHRHRPPDQRPPEPARRPAPGAGGGHRVPGAARAARAAGGTGCSWPSRRSSMLIANGISANAVEGPPIRVPVVVMALFAIGLAWRLRGEARPAQPSTVQAAETG